MTQLLIAGIEAVLPASFSVTVKRENPFFTKSGEYTYDVQLRLDNHINLDLYGFLNRLNRTEQVYTGRKAMLMADGRVYCRGTEVITRWTHDTVSVQIVSGESELNWLVGQDRKIEDLDMGEAEHETYQYDPNYKIFNHGGVYPVKDYCTPTVRSETGVMLNYLGFNANLRTCAQPYLCAIIRRMMSALGYAIGVNELEQTQFKNLFIVNTLHTAEYAKMLSGWKVGDFLSEVERLTGVVFLTNNDDPTNLRIDIVKKSTYYLESKQIKLNNVVDAYEAELVDDDSREAEFSTCDVSYELPSHQHDKVMKLPEGFLETATIIDYASLNEILQVSGPPTTAVYRDTSTGRCYVRVQREYTKGTQTMTETYWIEVNQFCNLDRADTTATLEIAITPAPMAYLGEYGLEVIDLGTTDGYHNNSISTDQPGSDTKDAIEAINSYAKKESQAGDLYCAFYCGVRIREVPHNIDLLPVAYTDDRHAQVQLQLHPSSDPDYQTGFVGDWAPGSLRLQDLDTDYYQGAYQIDTSRTVTFDTFDPNRIDVRQVYNIRGQRYVVRDVEETVTAEGRSPLWRVACHPIAVSDETIEKRWVLTKGVWDDGAAWLDDGRWNDSRP